MLSLPVWTIQYTARRRTLTSPLTWKDWREIDVGAADREGAEAAFNRRFPPSYQIQAISLKSSTGPA